LDLQIDLLGGLDERLLYISGCFGRCLHENKAMFSSECLTLLSLRLS
jgi:hypothetical protein